jgi:segregation and condensation protein B
MKRIAVSIGDLNGIGIELALRNHASVVKEAVPIYCIDRSMLEQAATLLELPIPDDFQTLEEISGPFTIRPGAIDAKSGSYSYASFVKAVEIARSKSVNAIVTLPIHKKAWELAGIHYKGHTDALRDFFDADAIMMLGSPKMYVALFTEHIPLKEVAGGYQFRTRSDYGPYILRMLKTAPARLSRAALETLAIIAYKQPILRQEIERLRGVDVGGILKTLLEKGLIRIVGRKNLPGRPLIYGTTKKFLEVFDLKDLDSLPKLKEIKALGTSEKTVEESAQTFLNGLGDIEQNRDNQEEKIEPGQNQDATSKA